MDELFIECDPENGHLCDACNPPHGTWRRYQLGDGKTRKMKNGKRELVPCDCEPCHRDHLREERFKNYRKGVTDSSTNECPPKGWRPPVLSSEWKRFAACTGNQDLFFPTKGQNFNAAKRICADCLVQKECLIWGAHYEDYGIWGGVGEKRRIRFRAKYGVKRQNLVESFLQ